MRIRREAGISLIEVMVAVIVFSIAIVFVGQMFWSGGSLVHSEGERRVALKMAEHKIEELKYAGYSSTGSDADWTSVNMNVGTHPTNTTVLLDDLNTGTTVDDLIGTMTWVVRDTSWTSMGVTVRCKIVNLRLEWPRGAVRDRVRVVTLVGE
jgi:type II secretory pathway pseudopilin PulG